MPDAGEEPAEEDGGFFNQPDANAPSDAFVPHEFLPAPSGRAIVPGGSFMKSSRYSAIVTAGQAPGDNRVMKSQRHTFIGGLIGSTGELQKERP